MNRTLSRCTVLAVLLLTAPAHAEHPAAVPLAIAEGHTHVLRLAKPARIAVADPSVIKVVLQDDTHLGVVALKAGQTELNVWTRSTHRTWTVTVTAPDASDRP